MNIKNFKSTAAIIFIAIFFTLSLNTYSIDPPCGDIDASGTVDISDIIYFVDFIFNDGPHIPFYLTVDFNNDNYVDIGDLVRFIEYILDNEQIENCSFVENLSSSCIGMVKPGEHPPFSQSGCQVNPVDSLEQMIVEWYGNSVKITHLNAFEQCCLEYKVDYDITYDNSTIFIDALESDTGFECDCMCYFNLESYSPELYISNQMDCIVTLYGINGSPVGTDTITVGGPGALVCETINNDLIITYQNAYFNCCPNFVTNIQLLDNTIVVNWQDTLGVCFCFCYFNLQTTLNDLSEGQYIVVLLGGDSGTDTVGVDTVYIEDGGPCVVSVQNSECKNERLTAASLEEKITYSYENGLLLFNHFDAEFNCSLDLNIQIELTGDTIRIFETNVTTEYVRCLCDYDVYAIFDNIPPGTYTAEVYKTDYFWVPLTLADSQIITIE